MTDYTSPMQPLPGLKPDAREIALPGGLKLFAYDAGEPDAPALLLVHGLGSEADTWRSVIRPLSQDFRVIAPDLPGFGRSAKPNRAYTVDFLTGTVLGLMDALSLEKVTLCGHSLGGILAHKIAADHPDRIERLILVGGTLTQRGGTGGLEMLLFLIPFVGEFLYNRMRNDPDAAYESLRRYYADLDKLPQEDRDFLYERVNRRVWSDDQRRAYFSTLRRMVIFGLTQAGKNEEKLPDLHIPTRVIWGAEDEIVSVESGRATVEAQLNAELIVIPNAGHNVQEEKPEAFLEMVGG
jgi:pimeloyl-ACP methyl ester carboxylesterase